MDGVSGHSMDLQGNHIVVGDFPAEWKWKILLPCSVPYVVGTTSAVLNARTGEV